MKVFLFGLLSVIVFFVISNFLELGQLGMYLGFPMNSEPIPWWVSQLNICWHIAFPLSALLGTLYLSSKGKPESIGLLLGLGPCFLVNIYNEAAVFRGLRNLDNGLSSPGYFYWPPLLMLLVVWVLFRFKQIVAAKY